MHPEPPYILVVEDDPTIAEVVARYLQREGYDTDIAFDGLDALEKAQNRYPDLVVLDLMLPRVDGFEVCRRLRAEGSTPIVMLTGKGEEMDKLVGLELGADDYMVKPFSPRELVARVKAVLRRTTSTFTHTSGVGLRFGPGFTPWPGV